MKENEQSILFNTHGDMDRTPDLLGRRAVNPDSERIMPHAQSRHYDFGDEVELTHPDGNKFGQGTLFPRHIRPCDLTDIQKTVRDEYILHKKGQPSRVVDSREAGGAVRVTVELKKYGVKKVGGFLRNGQVCTVFPEYDEE